MFATTTRQVSAHYCIDNNSIVQCVRDQDVAYAAPGANHDGVQLELAGYASQRSEQWDDAFSRAELALAAGLVRELCTKNAIPVQFVNVAGLQAGGRGITTHDAVSKAFRKSSHWDPGPNFPMEKFLGVVRGTATPVVPPQQEGVFVVNRPPVAIMPHPAGYWEVTDDGGVFSFTRQGAPSPVPFFGSTGGIKLNSPIVDAAPTPTGDGYWLVAADGGVFAFGGAGFHGSAGDTALNKPIKAIGVAPDGKGYWLMAQDGGIFAYGSAVFAGRVEYVG